MDCFLVRYLKPCTILEHHQFKYRGFANGGMRGNDPALADIPLPARGCTLPRGREKSDSPFRRCRRPGCRRPAYRDVVTVALGTGYPAPDTPKIGRRTWKDGQLTAAYRQPFDLLVKNVIALEKKKPAEHAQTGYFDNWLPGEDSNL